MPSELFKEAIADARAVRATALANAKAALEEAFTPRLQSMLGAKLREELEEDESMDDDMEVTSDEIDEILAELDGDLEDEESSDVPSDVPTEEPDMDQSDDEIDMDISSEDDGSIKTVEVPVGGEVRVTAPGDEVEDEEMSDIDEPVDDVELSENVHIIPAGTPYEKVPYMSSWRKTYAFGCLTDPKFWNHYKNCKFEYIEDSNGNPVAIACPDKGIYIDTKNNPMSPEEFENLKNGGQLSENVRIIPAGTPYEKVPYMSRWRKENAFGCLTNPKLWHHYKNCKFEYIEDSDGNPVAIACADQGIYVDTENNTMSPEEFENLKNGGEVNLEELLSELDEDGEEEIDINELLQSLSEDDCSDDEDQEVEEYNSELLELKTKFADACETIEFLRGQLNEVNLLNAKLLYTNKLFKAHSLDNSQKMRVVEAFDLTKSIREVKLTYNNISEALNISKPRKSTKPKATITEGFASKTTGTTKPTNKIVNAPVNDMASRFQTLAGIVK